MSAPARRLGPVFEPVDMRVEPGRMLPTTDDVAGNRTLREVPLLTNVRSSDSGGLRSGIRAFRAHGDGLQRDGVRDGDYVIIDAGRPAIRGAVVIARFAGELAVARVERNVGGVLQLTLTNPQSLPLAHSARAADVLGVLAGVIRKRGFGSKPNDPPTAPLAAAVAESNAPVPDALMAVRPPGRLGILRGRLGMLEMTCANTTNPRLRRALRKEAAHIRRLLQNETAKTARSK